MSKIFTVFGATGNQGGSVISHILDHAELSKTYKIRGVTRDPSKPKAVALTDKGVEVVAGNMDDAASIAKVIEGSDVVFGVTNFWETMSQDTEIKQGKAIVDAAKASKVERLIFSSLPNVSKESNGKQTGVKHFDSKALIEAYAREQGVPGTYFMPAVFMPGFLGSFKLGDDGTYTFTTGWDPATTHVPFIDPVADTGLYISAILLNLDDSTLGIRIAAAGDVVTPNQMAEAVAAVSGKQAKINQVPWPTFKSFLPPAVAEEMVANMELIVEPGYYVGEPEDAVQKGYALLAKSGLRKPHTWNEFVEKHLKA